MDHADSVVTRTPDAGDGTVPMYSALPTFGQRQIVVNEHATVFEGKPFRHVFFRLMGGDDGLVLEVSEEQAAAPGPRMALSLDSPVQKVDRAVEVTLGIYNSAAPGEPAAVDAINGVILLEAAGADGKFKPADVRQIPIAYAGPPTERLTILVPAIGQAGLYRLRFKGTPQAVGAAAFAVSSA